MGTTSAHSCRFVCVGRSMFPKVRDFGDIQKNRKDVYRTGFGAPSRRLWPPLRLMRPCQSIPPLRPRPPPTPYREPNPPAPSGSRPPPGRRRKHFRAPGRHFPPTGSHDGGEGVIRRSWWCRRGERPFHPRPRVRRRQRRPPRRRRRDEERRYRPPLSRRCPWRR